MYFLFREAVSKRISIYKGEIIILNQLNLAIIYIYIYICIFRNIKIFKGNACVFDF